MEVLGWIGSAAFAIMGFPQALECIKSGHSRYVNDGTLKLWLLGNSAMLIYVLLQPTILMPAVVSHLISGLFILTIFKYKVFPKGGKMTIKSMAKTHHKWIKKMGWNNKTPLEELALIAGEIGEACNECRGESPTERLGSELADIILRTMSLAENLNIDIEDELIRKMDINSKHGNKGRLK